VRGDLIQTYQILRGGFDRVDGEMLSLVRESGTRGQSYKIKGHLFNTEMCRNFLSQRVGNVWNSLSQWVLEAGSLEVFIVEVDKYSFDRGVEEMSQERSVRPTEISHVGIEWRGRLVGPNGLLLLLILILSLSLHLFTGP